MSFLRKELKGGNVRGFEVAADKLLPSIPGPSSLKNETLQNSVFGIGMSSLAQNNDSVADVAQPSDLTDLNKQERSFSPKASQVEDISFPPHLANDPAAANATGGGEQGGGPAYGPTDPPGQDDSGKTHSFWEKLKGFLQAHSFLIVSGIVVLVSVLVWYVVFRANPVAETVIQSEGVPLSNARQNLDSFLGQE